MRGTSLALVVVVVVLLGLASSAWAEDDASHPSVKASLSGRDKFLFGQYSTTTYTVMSASTSTVFFSCLSGTHTSICQGRKKRKSLGFERELPLSGDKNMAIQSSLEEDAADDTVSSVQEDAPREDELDKFAFTVWTTSRTTTSVTVYYTNTSSTVRVSYYCVAGQLSVPTNSCG